MIDMMRNRMTVRTRLYTVCNINFFRSNLFVHIANLYFTALHGGCFAMVIQCKCSGIFCCPGWLNYQIIYTINISGLTSDIFTIYISVIIIVYTLIYCLLILSVHTSISCLSVLSCSFWGFFHFFSAKGFLWGKFFPYPNQGSKDSLTLKY